MKLIDNIGGFIVATLLCIIIIGLPISCNVAIYQNYQHLRDVDKNHPFIFDVGDTVYHKTFATLPFIIIDCKKNYHNTYDNIYTCRAVLPPKIIEKSQNGQLFGSANSVDKSVISITENFYESELRK